MLMDEPFSAVDPIVRKGLQDELLRIQSELGKTIVFVTHDIDEAITIGDMVAVLRKGGKLAQYAARPAELLSAPRRRVRGGLPRTGPGHPAAVAASHRRRTGVDRQADRRGGQHTPSRSPGPGCCRRPRTSWSPTPRAARWAGGRRQEGAGPPARPG